MTLIVDASALYAQADADEPRHEAVRRLLREERGPLVTSGYAAAEADYLIMSRLGVDSELLFLRDLAAGTYAVECLTREELDTSHTLALRYRDLKLGLADVSLIALAHRYGTHRILTFDMRAFRRITALDGGAFVILPEDASV